jgi:hypothetical protein
MPDTRVYIKHNDEGDTSGRKLVGMKNQAGRASGVVLKRQMLETPRCKFGDSCSLKVTKTWIRWYN